MSALAACAAVDTCRGCALIPCRREGATPTKQRGVTFDRLVVHDGMGLGNGGGDFWLDPSIPGSQCMAVVLPALQHAWRASLAALTRTTAAPVVPLLARAWKGACAACVRAVNCVARGDLPGALHNVLAQLTCPVVSAASPRIAERCIRGRRQAQGTGEAAGGTGAHGVPAGAAHASTRCSARRHGRWYTYRARLRVDAVGRCRCRRDARAAIG